MSPWVIHVLVIFGGYLIGSIPTAYLVGRFAGKFNVTTTGTGNAGVANIWKRMGPRWGLFMVFLDLWKGAIPVLVATDLVLDLGPATQIAAGTAAIIGHCWPVTLRFKGGKGITPFVGALGVYSFPITAGLGLTALLGLLALRNVKGVEAPVVWLVLFLLFPIITWAIWFFTDPPTCSTVLCRALNPYPSLEMAILAAAFTPVSLIKRVIGNHPPIISNGESYMRVLLRRLVYDRDIADKDAWLAGTYSGKPG